MPPKVESGTGLALGPPRFGPIVPGRRAWPPPSHLSVRACAARSPCGRRCCAIGLDRGFALPFRVRDEFGRVSAAQELFRNAALLLDHERSALRLPDPHGVFGLGRIDLDVDEADDRHGVLLTRSRY